MKTHLDCIPCFFRQGLSAARMVTDDAEKQKGVLDAIATKIPEISADMTPPEMGITIYQAVHAASGLEDPYKSLKDHYNRLVLDLYSRLKANVQEAKDPLLMAIRYAIAGNIIDFGPQSSFDLEQEIAASPTRPFSIFDYENFRQALAETEEILYLGDNAGEIVFDKLLIETMNKPTTFVVRGKPIINDATRQDATFVGMDEVADVIDNGAGIPGTILKYCSSEFHGHYQKAKLIISKGQGNYESLSEENKPIFFMLKAKCPVVATHLNVPVGGVILKQAEMSLNNLSD